MKKTLENLTKAFIGESQARNRYTMYSSIAKKEGYEQIAEVFNTTANQEKEHAKRLFEHIQRISKKQGKLSEIKVEAESPLVLGDTKTNLEAAMKGEKYEYTKMYPEFADIAEEEGYPNIAKRLRSIAVAERHHEDRYKALLKVVKEKSVFKKKKKVWWTCRECGYLHYGTKPPDKCPSCDHAKNFYELKCEKF